MKKNEKPFCDWETPSKTWYVVEGLQTRIGDKLNDHLSVFVQSDIENSYMVVLKASKRCVHPKIIFYEKYIQITLPKKE